MPWWTVVPLAAVLAYADGFWMISLRGAVGERTDAPFETWLRESTLSIPIFVVAVLGALILALRLFGPAPRGQAYAATALLTVAAGTLAGIVEIAASSVYDYHLQSVMLQAWSPHVDCATDNCLQELDHASLLVQVHSVGYAGVILLVTNLVLVGWVLAFKGGRLDVTRRGLPQPEPTEPRNTRSPAPAESTTCDSSWSPDSSAAPSSTPPSSPNTSPNGWQQASSSSSSPPPS